MKTEKTTHKFDNPGMKYRKKPIIIEAMIFPDNGTDQHEVFMWVKESGGKLNLYDGNVENNVKTSTNANWRWNHASIETSEGLMSVNIGDYLIKEPRD
jgi:hypothetical protein